MAKELLNNDPECIKFFTKVTTFIESQSFQFVFVNTFMTKVVVNCFLLLDEIKYSMQKNGNKNYKIRQ